MRIYKNRRTQTVKMIKSLSTNLLVWKVKTKPLAVTQNSEKQNMKEMDTKQTT